MWYVYLLINTVSNRTYIGCTTDYKRRLRQHNRELVGGAKSTKVNCGYWNIALVLNGFNGRAEAMRWEKILKMRRKGLIMRSEGFCMVARGICPPPGKVYPVPQNVALEAL
jgi:predicted GIY-YIG superfamily endonuclease